MNKYSCYGQLKARFGFGKARIIWFNFSFTAKHMINSLMIFFSSLIFFMNCINMHVRVHDCVWLNKLFLLLLNQQLKAKTSQRYSHNRPPHKPPELPKVALSVTVECQKLHHSVRSFESSTSSCHNTPGELFTPLQITVQLVRLLWVYLFILKALGHFIQLQLLASKKKKKRKTIYFHNSKSLFFRFSGPNTITSFQSLKADVIQVLISLRQAYYQTNWLNKFHGWLYLSIVSITMKIYPMPSQN